MPSIIVSRRPFFERNQAVMKTWFNIKNSAAGEIEIYVFDEIGLYGIRASDFVKNLKAQANVKKIVLIINSPGGDPFDAIAMMAALRNHPAAVTVRIDGLAASAASILAMAGKPIIMPENAMLMIHNPAGGAVGEADDLRDVADALDKITLAIVASYRRSGKTDDEIKAIMADETWYTAAEAVAEGFADEVVPAVDIAARFDLAKFKNPPVKIQAQRAPVKPRKIGSSPDESLSPTDAADVVTACIKAGFPYLAAACVACGLPLDVVKERLKNAESIVKLCSEFGVKHRAEIYVRADMEIDEVRDNILLELYPKAFEGREPTDAEVRAYLVNTSEIRSACHAFAHGDHKIGAKAAAEFLSRNLSIDQVREELGRRRTADDVQLDNRYGPEGGVAVPTKNRINPAAIYARYNRKRLTREAQTATAKE